MSDLLLLLGAYVCTGLFAGLCAGLFGLGGGVVVVPALFFLFAWRGFETGLLMHLALGTSLAAAAFAVGASTLAHHRRAAVDWPVVRVLAVGMVLGALAGSAVAEWLPSRALQRLFGTFEVLIALQLLMGLAPAASRTLPRPAALWGVGAGIGSLSAVLGIGGGSLTVPYLLWCNVPLRRAIATSAACGLPITLAGALGFLTVGWTVQGLPAGSTGYVHWPAVAAIALGSVFAAPHGARLAHTMPLPALRRAFAAVVGVVGVEMLLG